MARKFIKIDEMADKLRLAKLFGVTRELVDKALSFRSDSETARKIRRAAMNQGAHLFIESDDWKRDLKK